MEKLEALFEFLTELEKLKLVHRRSYVSDLSRHENSAEHSWHLALALLVFERELGLQIDLTKALKLALIHDVCEIDAGDVPVYAPERDAMFELEKAGVERLSRYGVRFAGELLPLWLEYEEQTTLESRWVRVFDRLLPFMINLTTGGQTWIDQDISRSQVLRINQHVAKQAPEIYAWMLGKIDQAVAKGWLRDE
jgi:putative hydrolase of HD superfamily